MEAQANAHYAALFAEECAPWFDPHHAMNAA
jgi:hypothetical protein